MKQEDTNQNTMNIQWYPGHMTKTRRMIEEDVKLVDAVCEILDARIPIASRNPDIDAICGNKPRMIVLNRIDMADPALTKKWAEHFRAKGYAVLQTDCKTKKGISGFSCVSDGCACKFLSSCSILKIPPFGRSVKSKIVYTISSNKERGK